MRACGRLSRAQALATFGAALVATTLGCEEPTQYPGKPAPAPPASARASVSASATPSTSAAPGAAGPAANDPRVQKARDLALGYGKRLKGELTRAMGEGGPSTAIAVCGEVAPEIAKDVEAGWSVGRTALRVRNPANEPDDWERATLERFAEAMARGAKPETLETWEEQERGGRRTFRYMRAIPTEALCLTCHGKDLGAELEAVVRERYPADRATGFDIGELRGAFSLEAEL